MHILITDSGVGGLSVCAYAERFLRTHGIGQQVKLTYVNASPENDFGYNTMSSRREKLENFDRFLRIIVETFLPDSIYIACNTLSVLFPDTQFSKHFRVPVQGIVDTGVNYLLHDLAHSPLSTIAIFGTETTIGEGTYSRLLELNGIEENRIVSQACPSLADTISEDRQGLTAKRKIETFVEAAIAETKMSSTHYLTYLACTHYGYRKDYFEQAFADRGFDTQILNPNEFAVEELFGKKNENAKEQMKYQNVDVEFITRYRIPETALETITFFLGDISPKTVQAFTNYTHAPDLF